MLYSLINNELTAYALVVVRQVLQVDLAHVSCEECQVYHVTLKLKLLSVRPMMLIPFVYSYDP
jgi:hypothetical protein